MSHHSLLEGRLLSPLSLCDVWGDGVPVRDGSWPEAVFVYVCRCTDWDHSLALIVIHRLKYMAIQWILLVQLLTSLGDTEGVAFLCIELYLPSLGPDLEWSEVSLELISSWICISLSQLISLYRRQSSTKRRMWEWLMFLPMSLM